MKKALRARGRQNQQTGQPETDKRGDEGPKTNLKGRDVDAAQEGLNESNTDLEKKKAGVQGESKGGGLGGCPDNSLTGTLYPSRKLN